MTGSTGRVLGRRVIKRHVAPTTFVLLAVVAALVPAHAGFYEAPNLSTDQFHVLNLPTYPSYLVVQDGRLTHVRHTELAAQASVFGFEDDAQPDVGRLITTEPLAPSEPAAPLGSTTPPDRVALGDFDGDGSPELVAAVQGKLRVTSSLSTGGVADLSADLTLNGLTGQVIGVGVLENGSDKTKNVVWVATTEGVWAFRKICSAGSACVFKAVAQKTGFRGANQTFLDAATRSLLDHDVLGQTATAGYLVNVVPILSKTSVSESSDSVEIIRVLYDFGHQRFADSLQPRTGLRTQGKTVGAGRLAVDRTFSGGVRNWEAAFVTEKEDARHGTLFLDDEEVENFCPSSDVNRQPSFDFEAFDEVPVGSQTSATGPWLYAACASDSLGAGFQHSLKVETAATQVNTSGTTRVSTTVDGGLGGTAARNIQTMLDFPCPWIVLETPSGSTTSSPPTCSGGTRNAMTNPGRLTAMVQYQGMQGENRAASVTVDPGNQASPAVSFHAEALPTGGTPVVVQRPPEYNKVKIKVSKTEPDIVNGLAIPLVVLAAPPLVANAGQEPLSGPVYGKLSESGTSAGQSTSNSFGTTLGLELEDPTGAFGVSAAVTMTSETGTDVAREETVETAENFVGAPADDVVVFSSSTFWRYQGEVVESSTGAGLGTDVTMLVPRSSVISSANLGELQRRQPETFGKGGDDKGVLSGLLSHTPGNPASYMGWSNNGDNVVTYCDNAALDGNSRATDEGGGYPWGVKDNPFLLPALKPRPLTGPGVLYSDTHRVQPGSTGSEGATVRITNRTEMSRIATKTVSAELAVKTGVLTGGYSASHSWAKSWTTQIGDGVEFQGYVGHIPTNLPEEQYDWRMFLCKKRIGADGTGVPVWVLNYTVDGYKGSGGIEVLGDIALTAPIHSVTATPTPAFSWSQESGTVRSYSLELESVGTPDHRVVSDLELVTSTSDATKGQRTVSVNWAELPEQTPLLQNQLYRWRATAVDFFGRTTASPWEFFVTEGPPREPKLEASSLTPTVGQGVTLTATHGATSVTDYTFQLGDGRTVTQQSPTLTTSYAVAGVYPVQVAITNGYGTSTASTTLSVGPEANDEGYVLREDTVLERDATAGVMANDTGADSVRLTSSASHGALRLAADGAFSYTPSRDYCGTDQFAYAVQAGGAARFATTTLTIECVNDRPTATDTSYSGTEDNTLTVTAPGLLTGASDADGDPLTAAIVSTPSNGRLELAQDGSFAYVPRPDYCGSDSFRWSGADRTSSSDAATVTLLIECVNDTPTTVPDSYDAVDGTELSTVAPGLLRNDTDADGDVLWVQPGTVTTSGGTLTVSADGGFRYTARPGFYGTDVASYTAQDRAGASAQGTITFRVRARTTLSTGPAQLTYNNRTKTYSAAMQGTLQAVGSGQPVVDQPVVFKIGGEVVCTATTDTSGAARCTGTVPKGQGIPSQYSASFGGSAEWLPASSSGSLRLVRA